MKLDSYWHDTAPAFSDGQADPVEGRYDVAVIGAGFTGLSAARKLARDGVKVAVLDAAHVGAGGSGRNGGHLNNGLAHGYADAKTHLGAERAMALYQAYDRSIELIEEVIAEEGLHCDFRRSGKLKLASKPSHVAGLRTNQELVAREVDPDTAWLERDKLADEIGSQAFHGAALFKKSAMMHMGKYLTGLADAAVRHGAMVWENAPVKGRRKIPDGWELDTPRGQLRANKVIAATGAYSGQVPGAPLDFFRKRIISMASFVIATRPLSDAEVAATMPGNRTCVTSMNIGNYFRMSTDNRLILGGRARFSAVSDERSDTKSGELLRAAMEGIFPHLAGTEIDYCWGGLVGLTTDRFPRAGVADGMIYGMGYSGHGAQLSTLLGQVLADLAIGRRDTNPLDGMEWPAVPALNGKPWFLPLAGMWFKIKDRLS
jgi:glycine/D-amino acid oxidase-like deaminating enzyme